MMSAFLTQENFMTGIKSYLNNNAYGNAVQVSTCSSIYQQYCYCAQSSNRRKISLNSTRMVEEQWMVGKSDCCPVHIVYRP